MLRPTGPAGPESLEQELKYRRARDTLDLSLHTDDGAEVDTARIDILTDDSTDSGLSLEVSVVDRGFWS